MYFPAGPEPQPPPTPPDDYIIGDRVYVGGTKPGFIAYLGETQFAPGEWAGIVLDESIGKNDGSVAGVRYFQCEPKRGVFARPTKLSREPVSDSDGSVASTPAATPVATPTPMATPARGLKPANGITSAPSSARKPSLGTTRSVARSNTNLSKGDSSTSPGGSVSNLSVSGDSSKSSLRVGDRVLVSGTKAGTLRYLGATDFAKGEWAGVELDEMQGKNDGAVAGKR